ncbi:MAG: hypothetical protein L0287_18555 [Anaerolineae bacterium]|nr:hypothetical protein [Anaerolineae bacterium]MCI0608074.1 hypothetical protein [Anaerolineae bacterium]
MFILITILILFLTALTLLILRFFTPEFRYSWVIATVGALVGWISVFAWQAQMPIALQFSIWQPSALFFQSPSLIADGISWAFAVSLAALCLAIIITSVVRANFPSPLTWVGSLVLTSFGILAVVADNPLTLVLIWAAIDLVELVTQMRFVEDPRLSERVVIAFASRTIGILTLLWADMVSIVNGQILDFRSAQDANPQAGLYLVIAAGLRIGVLPLHLPYPSESSIRRGFGTGLRMISAASSLILLARIPPSSVASPFTPYLLMLVSFAAVYGSWMWLRAPDELTGRPYWLIGMGSLAIAAALRANPIGAAAWGCALILSGGALFLSSEQNKWMTRALFIGAWGISSLPFSLSATGWNSGGVTFWLAWPFLLVSHAMLIAGFIRHIQRTMTRTGDEDQPIWAKNVYPIGIFLLLMMVILLGLFGWDGTLQFGNWIMGLIASIATIGLLWLIPRLRILNPVRAHWVRPTNASWLEQGYQTLWGVYRQLARLSNTFTNMLEGESGIMWTLLFLALFISFFTQGTP